jgi:polyisoprenoid-binding protein YceI
MIILHYRRIRRIQTGILIFLSVLTCSAHGQMHPVTKESFVHFTIHNFGFKVTGLLDPPQGNIQFNPDSLSGSFFHVTIKTESINTDNNSRDEHLKAEDYFDIKKYPLISFTSDDIKKGGKKNEYELSGKLTIKDKTKNIIIPFTADKSGSDYIFNGSFKMDRRDYGIGSGSTISNELTVEIKVLAR